jgi:TPR repeat protein
LNPNQQIFSIDDSDDDETTTKPKTTDPLDQDKIQQLEEKIQRLERVLALQDLENKITNKDESDIFAQPSSLSVGAEQNQQKQDSLNSVNSSITELGAPPLPPPPPPEKKSLLNSPKANLFVSEMESENIKKLKDSDLRLSTSSLIPTDKSLSDQSLDDAEDHHFNDNDNDEPPPSYEELEKSGTLTYSQSIYRTGFEKAGYQLDHVATPLSTPKDVKTTLKRLAELELNDAGSTDSNIRILNKKKSNILMSKRKIPLQITDDMFDNSSFKNALNSIPTHQSIDKPIKTHPQHPIDHQYIPIPVPEPAVLPSSQPQKQNYNYKAPSQTLATKSTDTLNKASTLDSSYTNKKSNDVMNVIKYSTDSSFEILANGVIQPILPSKCKESPEETIAKFRKTREKALADYKQFTPKIQFYWAILLLETLSKSEVISKMTIDGKIRKSELSFKKLKKQRSMFLITAVKVLEKLIQIAPNDTRARLYLGDIYSGGIHPGLIERDETLGYQLFYDSATKQNDPVACYRIACCLESGVGVKQDIPKSIIFFEKGASLGDPSSMCQLGMMHFAGVNGCVQDILLSISYHKQAYETLRSKTVMSYDPLISSRSFQDARGALYTLAKLHQTDSQILCLTDLNDLKTSKTIDDLKFSNVWCNKSKALKYYLEASKLGHNESQACLGYYYSQGFFPTHLFKSDKDSNNGIADPVDPRKSIYWFSKAAADGHTYASLGLARWYGSGAVDNDGKVILKRDEQQAFLWGRKAADAGELVEAEFMIGVCFEQGFGVEKNLIMAANYFERSARKGYKKSIVKLKAMRKQ